LRICHNDDVGEMDRSIVRSRNDGRRLHAHDPRERTDEKETDGFFDCRMMRCSPI